MGTPYNRLKKLERHIDPFWMDYNDTATAGTPITLTSGVPVTLTNDGLGAFTNKQFNRGVELWNPGTNQFDFTGLEVGDVLQIRIDLTPTLSGVNGDTFVRINLGVGGSPYTLSLWHGFHKASGTYNNEIVNATIYMGDLNTLNNPATLEFESDVNGSLIVNGWFLNVI